MQDKPEQSLRNQLLILLLLSLATIAGGPDSCNSDASTAKTDANKSSNTQVAKGVSQATVEIVSPTGRKSVFHVEVARSAVERARGLMYRESLPQNAGMLFIFPWEDVQHFWMKNTPLSLDMFFIDDNYKVVGVIENAVPNSKSSMSINASSRFVLETNAGIAKKFQFTRGSVVKITGVDL